MPGKGAFKRCVAKVAAKGGAADPRAVCAAAGRKKYGAKRFAAMAKAGRKKAARAHRRRNPLPFARRARPDGQFDIVDTRTGEIVRTVKTKSAAMQVVASLNGKALARRGNPRNPVTEAAERYEDFHGEPPKETYAFEEAWHYHGVTTQVGVLVSLKIAVPKLRGGGVVTVKGFKDARLTMNEAGTQLYVEGGDQALDLASFGIKEPHEREYLGEGVEVTYHTTKKHLGKEGGEANYVHKFGRIEGGGKTERPKMIYDVLNEEIIFAGGGYTIPSEGIDG